MRHFRSIKAASIAFVFVIMVSAGAMTTVLTWILYKLRILPALIYSGTTIPVLCLCVSCVIGTVISAFFTSHFLKPIRELIAATRTIAKGDFSVRVETKETVGEVADLITSFNMMAEELGSIEMFRSDFINTFSHEFKTPIVSIRGFARQLRHAQLSEEQRMEYADIIVQESEQLARMSSNVLLLSKLEHQTILSDCTVFSLDEQVRSDILLLESRWEEKRLEIDPDLSSVDFYGNAEVLSELWINLLTNAIKFTPEGGRISVRLSQSDGEVHVTVKDNGIGMSRETMAHVFEKFYQGDASHAGEGNGLGLSLVKRIVELYSGKISIESEIGKGTSVYVSLPKHSSEGENE